MLIFTLGSYSAMQRKINENPLCCMKLRAGIATTTAPLEGVDRYVISKEKVAPSSFLGCFISSKYLPEE